MHRTTMLERGMVPADEGAHWRGVFGGRSRRRNQDGGGTQGVRHQRGEREVNFFIGKISSEQR